MDGHDFSKSGFGCCCKSQVHLGGVLEMFDIISGMGLTETETQVEILLAQEDESWIGLVQVAYRD